MPDDLAERGKRDLAEHDRYQRIIDARNWFLENGPKVPAKLERVYQSLVAAERKRLGVS